MKKGRPLPDQKCAKNAGPWERPITQPAIKPTTAAICRKSPERHPRQACQSTSNQQNNQKTSTADQANGSFPAAAQEGAIIIIIIMGPPR
jgi:hypothetical protein